MRRRSLSELRWKDGVEVLRLALRADRIGTASVVCTSFLVGAAPAAQVKITALLTGSIVTAFGANGLTETYKYLILLGIVGLLAQVAALLQARSISRCQAKLTADLGSRVVEKCAQLTLPQLEDPKIHDSIQRALREVNFRPGALISEAAQLCTSIVTFLSVGAILLSLDYRVALLALLAPIPVIAGQLIQGRRSYNLEYGRSEKRRRQNYWHHLVSQPASMKEILAFDTGRAVQSRYLSLVRGLLGQDLSLANRNTALMVPMVAISGCLVLGAQLVALTTASGAAAVSPMIAVIQSIGYMQGSLQQLFSSLASFYNNLLFMKNIAFFFSLPVHPAATSKQEFPRRLEGLEFRDVSFSYPNSSSVAISHVSLTIRPGEVTAIVGANGSGKSTLTKLMANFYQDYAGDVLVGGRRLSDISNTQFRANVAFVFQDYVNYQLNVLDNVMLRGDSTEVDLQLVRDAISDVGMRDWLDRQPDELMTETGRTFGNGTELSGGQWQRLAIARALVRDPQVLILDEPTSAVDTVAESEIFDRLSSFVETDRIAVIVAHKLSMIRRADRILVFDSGSLVEDGDHESLILAGGCYSKLFDESVNSEEVHAG